MKKILLIMPLMAISLLASCNNGGEDKPEPTEYTLTLTLNDCNVDGASTYSKKYTEGSTIDSVIVSPNDGFALKDDSVDDTYKQYWKASTGGNYVLSDLVMNSNFDITITASSSYTITYINLTSEETSSFTKTYTSDDLPLTLSTPTRTDWTFSGYYTDEIFTETSKLTNNTIPVGTTGNLTLYAKMMYKTTTLEDCSWTEIKTISELGGARATFGEIDGTQTKIVQLKHQDSAGDGADVISGNELYQTVRIIGYGEDYENITKNEDGEWVKSNPIGITFEFVDQISDENGLSLATYWNDTAAYETSNHKYDESTINKALNGTTNDINWFRYYGENEDTPETGKNLFFATENNYKKSLINMLPDGLTEEGILKAPSKYININDGDVWEEGISKQKLFLLSSKEMGNTDEEYTRFEEEHTTPYSYYEGSQKSDRIKNQVSCEEGSRANWVEVISGVYTEAEKYGFAGYYESSGSKGGYSWLRSPSINNDFAGWHLSNNGGFGAGIFGVFQNALGIAPAFCI